LSHGLRHAFKTARGRLGSHYRPSRPRHAAATGDSRASPNRAKPRASIC
jgi:hypothetical protein